MADILNSIASAVAQELRHLSRIQVLSVSDGIGPIPGQMVDREMEIITDKGVQHLKVKGAPMMFGSDSVMRRVLRIEIDSDTEYEMLHAFFRYGTGVSLDDPKTRKFLGVDIYLVRDLPAPGWRVVNPMR